MTDLTGQTIDQYQIVERIHQGENTVYKGFQAAMNRYVAVKILNPALTANPAFAQTFPQNMQRITALQHPNILPIYDYGQQGELFYIVSQYVETGTLKDRLPPAFTLQQAQAMLNPISEALDYTYPLGVGHGNIKPSNILINAQGQPLLTDLGYVQGIDVSGPENVYLSPEQRQGFVPDLRSDVYALGVLLYHMLIGEPPLPGTVVSVRTKRPDLPDAVEKVILTATAQTPEQRFQTPGQLRDTFNQALLPPAVPVAQAVPVPSPALSQAAPPAPAAESKSGGPSWMIILAVGLIGVCCLLGVLGLFVVGGDREIATPTPPPDIEQPAPEPPPPPDGSLLQGLLDMIAGIFDSLADIIDSILGGGTTPPEPPGEQPIPEESPTPESPPPQPEQPLPEESGDAPAE